MYNYIAIDNSRLELNTNSDKTNFDLITCNNLFLMTDWKHRYNF